MLIETRDFLVETHVKYAQIEITGLCNMNCKHCRAIKQDKRGVSLENMDKLFKFIQSVKDEDFLLGLSGGEPFLHPQLYEILALAKHSSFNNITITTNGSLVNDLCLKVLDNLAIEHLMIQVSIDSVVARKHDEFRGYTGAFEHATNLIRRIKKYSNIKSSIRSTITPNTIDEVNDIIDLAYRLGADEIDFSFVKPVGAAKDSNMLLSKDERKHLLNLVREAKIKYTNRMQISSGDPLRVLLDKEIDNFVNTSNEDELILGGCLAGIATFNVDVNGNITPCAMINDVICNYKDFNTAKEIEEAYASSPIVKSFINKEYSGNCGRCKYKYLCGGCRAIAAGVDGDVCGSDVLCWRANK